MTDDRLTPEGTARDHATERVRRTDVTPATPDLGADTDATFELTGRPVTEVHQWLDGEASEAEARRADARETEMWAKIQGETERRGRMTTPAPVLDRLMAAIPAEPQQDGVMGKIKKLFGK